MAKKLQLRRGTTVQHGSFTGAVGECTVDTDKDTLVVHDGAQAGGRPLLREDLNNLANDSVSLGHLQNIAGNSILGNNTASATDAIELTAAQVRTFLNVENDADANVNPTVSYNVVNGDGTITMNPGGDTAIVDNVTTSVNGLMLASDKVKLDGIDTSADVTDATTVANAGAVMEGDTTTANMSFVVDEDNMASDIDTKLPTQQSVKAYVDAKADITAGTSNVTVASGGDITVTRSSTARLTVNNTGADVNGTLTVDGLTNSGNTTLGDANSDTCTINGVLSFDMSLLTSV